VADANLPESSLRWIASNFGPKTRGGTGPRLYLDPVSVTKARKLLGIASGFDCVKPNRAEASLLAGFETGVGARDPASLCLAMGERGNLPDEIFISLGSDGMFYRTREAHGVVALPGLAGAYPAVNRSGAGDAACAALVWADALGLGALERAEFALAASMLTASCPDPVHPAMRDETLRLLRRELFCQGD
jgi:pseudouridine kinase